ncbi:hypothetical protein RlegWSM1455_26380 (plasmid) [Rhizobium laguerreae]|nr:hypothetical protein [Rhizobium laguerreae]UFW67836.1 hypothetical protein RlegWSM1455_26380 [Rhizobium laguerreae]
MFVKLTDGTITRWINMDAVIQMRFDEDKHQTELFLLREWSMGGPNGRRR